MKHYVGIDLGGTNIAAGVVDENYAIIASHSAPTMARRGFEAVVSDMAKATLTVIDKAGLTLENIESIGIGVPSSKNTSTNRAVFANNLGWRDAPIIEEFGKHIKKSLYWANDADCAALGEAVAGVSRKYESSMLLTLGTGIGGGTIYQKRIFTGFNRSGSELGHTTLVLDGVLCTCGRYGCFEAYASITALIRETIEAIAKYPDTVMREICSNDISKISGRTAFEAAKAGDKAGTEVVARYAYYVGHGITSLVAAFKPDAVIIGGGISNEGEYLLAPIRKTVSETLHSKGLQDPPDIIKASLGNSAGIIGAAVLDTQEYTN